MTPATSTTSVLALLGSAGVLALLVIAISFLRRRSFLVRQLTFPLILAALAATLLVFGRLRPGYAWLPVALSWTLLFLGLATILRLLAMFLFDVHLQGQRGVRLPPLLPAVAMALVYLVTALVTLKLAFPGFDIGPLLATSAVTSLVLGLALQPILANFFAGLVISLERPFRINDWIRVGDHQEGRVVAITWRTTHLRTRDNDNIVIPNAKLADERVHNFYYPHPLHLERIRVPVHYKEPPYRVRRVLTDCAAGVPGTLDKPSPDVYVIAFEDSAVIYELRVWIDDVANSPRIGSDLRSRAWEELRRAGMSIPYPTRTLHLAPRSAARRPGAQRPGASATTAMTESGESGESAQTEPAGGAQAPAAQPLPPHPPAAASGVSGIRGAQEAAPTPARLYVLEGPERGRSLALSGSPATVGRSRGCTLALTDPNASKEHLRIAWENGSYVVTDLGSSFGTRLNGQAVSRAALSPLDRIAVGDTVMIFETDET
ncbi:MAG TPA: mechanosensitive ion channel domain-containing protein [Thermoanaerobaculia bacterium]|jgi:small-conductance mechanosensitive channel|nr:mechanosensitive ion channel domain-containing protein [Thermoanaerobaculia bacterium]